MSEETLKPCPFCGGELKKTPDGLTHKCPQGKCNTLSIYKTHIKHFLKVWNSRPIEDALRARVKELEAENNAKYELLLLLRGAFIIGRPNVERDLAEIYSLWIEKIEKVIKKGGGE